MTQKSSRQRRTDILREVVYTLVMLIPMGCTATYSAIAQAAGTSPRAVGALMRANKNLIVVPCHRVVSSRGLGGYSRGIEAKKKLLEMEGAIGGGRLVCRARSPEELWRILEEHGYLVAMVDP